MSDEKDIITIDNVRIRRYNNMNFVVERYEDVFIPTKKTIEKRWVFHGYKSTILKALQLISSKELLINETQIKDLKGYIKQVEESNAKLAELLEVMKE